MFQTKLVKKIKTHILCSVTFFFFENRAVYEIMWVEKIWSKQTGHRRQPSAEKVRFARLITKAKIQTHTQNM